jgi:hypothetical protein
MKKIYRTLVDLTGEFINKTESELAPRIIINILDAGKASCIKSLQGLTTEEFTELEEHQEENLNAEGVLGEISRDLKAFNITLSELNRVALSKANIYCSPVEELIKAFDSETTIFQASGSEEFLAELLNGVQTVEKGTFVLKFKPVGELAKVASEIAKDLSWSGRILKGSILLSNEKQTVGEVWSGQLAPVIKKNEKVAISKAIDLGGFENFQQLITAMNDQISQAAIEGVYGYKEEEEEAPEPPYICIESIDEEFCYISVYLGWNEPYCYYRVPMTVEAGEVSMEFPGEVVEVLTVFILPTEEIIIQPKGTSETTPEVAPEGEASEETPDASSVEAGCNTGAGGKKKPSKKKLSESTENKLTLNRVLKVDTTQENSPQLVYGVVLEPTDGSDGEEITPDAQGDIYSSSEIEQAAHKWMADFFVTGIMHDSIAGRAVIPVQSFIAPESFSVNEEKIKKGSWILVCKVSDEIWARVQKGELNAWSMGGFAVREASI